MIIIAGALQVDPADRSRYLDAVREVTRLARSAPGCLDFTQAPDPLDPDRIIIYERWETDEHLQHFRTADGPTPQLPPVRAADVHKYRISGVEEP